MNELAEKCRNQGQLKISSWNFCKKLLNELNQLWVTKKDEWFQFEYENKHIFGFMVMSYLIINTKKCQRSCLLFPSFNQYSYFLLNPTRGRGL